jgi:hypothetical protein
MSLNPRKSPAVLSALSALLALFVAACLPIWTVRVVLSDPPTRLRHGSLLECLMSLSADTSHDRHVALDDLIQWYGRDFLLALAILLAGSAAGLLFRWLVLGAGRPGRGP